MVQYIEYKSIKRSEVTLVVQSVQKHWAQMMPDASRTVCFNWSLYGNVFLWLPAQTGSMCKQIYAYECLAFSNLCHFSN